MRQLLMTIVLIAFVVTLYMYAVQGENGMKSQIWQSGTRMADEISRISP